MGIVHIPSPLQLAPGPLNTCAPTNDPIAPEFLVSLNTCTPKEKVKPSMDLTSPKTIQAVLEHIVGRLNGPLDPIWDGPDGHHAEWQPRTGCSQEEKDRIAADEEWARWCTELMVLTNYNSTGAYGTYAGPLYRDKAKGFNDRYFFKSFFDTNPVVPIGMACQQLCTYAYYSRGYSYHDVRTQKETDDKDKPDDDDKDRSVGVSASHNSHLAHLFVGGWQPGGWQPEPKPKASKYTDLKAGFARNPGPLAPGSILGFLPSNKGGGQPQGSHVVFVLRAAPSVSKAQFLDTGAVSMKGSRSKQGTAPHAARGWNGGNYDGQLFQDEIKVSSGGIIPVCGLGVLKMDKSPAQIRAGIARAKLNRPLGVVRLLLLKRAEKIADQQVLYVSPYMWMHDRTSASNYFTSRLIWSLREIPSYETIQPIWAIFFAENEMATRHRDAVRTAPLKDVWAKGDAPIDSVYLTADADGRARVLLRVKLQQQTKKDANNKYKSTVTKVEEPSGTLAQYAKVVQFMKKLAPGSDHLEMAGQLVVPPYFAPW